MVQKQHAKLDTLALLLQGFKWILQEHFDEMKGTGSLRQTQKYHAGKLLELIDQDVLRLYRLMQAHGDGDELVSLYYDAIDLVREMIETTAEISQQQNPAGGTVGVPLMRTILREIRAGNFATVEELPEGVKPGGQVEIKKPRRKAVTAAK